MASLKEWFVACRPHTASLTVPGTLLGLFASGTTDPRLYVAFGIWALVFHGAGFLQNNICDRHADAKDKSKTHFPLVSGSISVTHAKIVTTVGMVTLAATGIAMATRAGSWPAFWALASAMVFGMLYNARSKTSAWSPFYIAISFASLPLFAFLVGGGHTAHEWTTAWFLVIYAFLLMFHQSTYSGYLKDLESDPVSWIRSMGGYVKRVRKGVYDYHIEGPVEAWGWVTRFLCPVVAIVYMGRPTVLWGAWAGMLVWAFYGLSASGVWQRKVKIAFMGGCEILIYFILLEALRPMLGVWEWAFYFLPFLWYLAVNQVLWRDAFRPAV